MCPRVSQCEWECLSIHVTVCRSQQRLKRRKSWELRLPRINKCNGEAEQTMDLETETPSDAILSILCFTGLFIKRPNGRGSLTLTSPIFLILSRFLPSLPSPLQEECFFESSHFSFVSVASVYLLLLSPLPSVTFVLPDAPDAVRFTVSLWLPPFRSLIIDLPLSTLPLFYARARETPSHPEATSLFCLSSSPTPLWRGTDSI